MVGRLATSNNCDTSSIKRETIGSIGEGDGHDNAQQKAEHGDALPRLEDKKRGAGAEAREVVSSAEGINPAAKGLGTGGGGGGGGLASDAIDSRKKGISSSTETLGKVALLHVRPGPRGGEKAVTFAVESLVSAGGFAIKAVLDCAGSVNASPLPGSKGLSREVWIRFWVTDVKWRRCVSGVLDRSLCTVVVSSHMVVHRVEYSF